jgi:PAS domain-containing protein
MDNSNPNIQALQEIQNLEKAIEEYMNLTSELIDITKSLETQIYRIRKDENGEYRLIFNEGKIAERYNISTSFIYDKKINEVYGDKLFDELKPNFDKAFKGETAQSRGFLFKKRFFSTVLTPFKQDRDGKVIEISGITQDINELFEIERKYLEKEEVLNNIIEYNPYSIQICDANGYQIKHNNAFLKIFKSSPAKEWSLFNDPLLKQSGFFNEILKVKNGEIIEIPEIWYNSHDVDPKYPDNLRCLRAIHFPIFNIKNELENIILMHEDITSKMALRKRVKELEEFHELAVGREIMMKKLETELADLKLKVYNNNS